MVRHRHLPSQAIRGQSAGNMTAVIASAASAASALCGVARRFASHVMEGVWSDAHHPAWHSPNPSVVNYRVGGGICAIPTHLGRISEADCDTLYECLTDDADADTSPTNDFFHVAGGYFFATCKPEQHPFEDGEDAGGLSGDSCDDLEFEFEFADESLDGAVDETSATPAVTDELCDFLKGIDAIVNPLTPTLAPTPAPTPAPTRHDHSSTHPMRVGGGGGGGLKRAREGEPTTPAKARVCRRKVLKPSPHA
jgi:hypothetical protein